MILKLYMHMYSFSTNYFVRCLPCFLFLYLFFWGDILNIGSDLYELINLICLFLS